MKLIKDFRQAHACAMVYRQHSPNEYIVKLSHLTEKEDNRGRQCGVMVEYVPARYHTDSKEDALETAQKMLEEASNTAPADPVRYNEWRSYTIKYVESQFIGRADGVGIENGADFIAGACAAMMAVAEQLYKTDPEQVGGVISPRWLFGCMRGGLDEAIRKAHQKREAVQ